MLMGLIFIPCYKEVRAFLTFFRAGESVHCHRLGEFLEKIKDTLDEKTTSLWKGKILSCFLLAGLLY
jgi:hypothetical protein